MREDSPQTEVHHFGGFNFYPRSNNVNTYQYNHPLIQHEKIRAKDMYQFPARKEEAEGHRKGNMFGYRSPPEETQNQRKCACCGYSVNLYPAHPCESIPPHKEVAGSLQPKEISSEVSLFLYFVKTLFVYLLIRLIFCQLLQMIANAFSHFTGNHHKYSSFNGLMTLVLWPSQRFQNLELVEIQGYINLVYVLVMIVFFVFYRKNQGKMFNLVHQQTYCQEDYTILVQNIPFFSFLQQQTPNTQKQPINPLTPQQPPYLQLLHLSRNQVPLSDLINTQNANIVISQALRLFFDRQTTKWRQKVQRQGYDNRSKLKDYQQSYYSRIKQNDPYNNMNLAQAVKSITLCFDLADLDKVKQLRQKMMKEHRNNYEENRYLDQHSKNYPPSQIQLLAEKQIEIQKHFATFNNPELTLSHFLGKAFISFSHQEIKDFFAKKHHSDLKLVYDDQTCLKITQASPPRQVNWFKLNNNSWLTTKSILLSLLMSAMMIILGLMIVSIIQTWRINSGFSVLQFSSNSKKILQKTQTGTIYFLIICLITKILQTIMGMIIAHFIDNSPINSKDNTVFVKILVKIPTYFLFLGLAASIFSEYWTTHLKSWDTISVTLNLFIGQCLLMRTIPNILMPDQLIHHIRLKCWYSDPTSLLYQTELNKLYEYPQFDISQRYTFYVVWLFIVSFFGSIAPVPLAIFSVICLLNYWVDKYNLLRRNSNPIPLTQNLTSFMVRIMEFDIVIFTLGNLMTMLMVQNKQPPLGQHSYLYSILPLGFIKLAIIGLVIAVIYKIVVELLSEIIWPYHSREKTYSQALSHFRHKYWTQNPATKFAQQGRYEFQKTQRQLKDSRVSEVIQYKNPSLPIIPNNSPSKQEEEPAQQQINLQKEYHVAKPSRRKKNNL